MILVKQIQILIYFYSSSIVFYFLPHFGELPMWTQSFRQIVHLPVPGLQRELYKHRLNLKRHTPAHFPKDTRQHPSKVLPGLPAASLFLGLLPHGLSLWECYRWSTLPSCGHTWELHVSRPHQMALFNPSLIRSQDNYLF